MMHDASCSCPFGPAIITKGGGSRPRGGMAVDLGKKAKTKAKVRDYRFSIPAEDYDRLGLLADMFGMQLKEAAVEVLISSRRGRRLSAREWCVIRQILPIMEMMLVLKGLLADMIPEAQAASQQEIAVSCLKEAEKCYSQMKSQLVPLTEWFAGRLGLRA